MLCRTHAADRGENGPLAACAEFRKCYAEVDQLSTKLYIGLKMVDIGSTLIFVATQHFYIAKR